MTGAQIRESYAGKTAYYHNGEKEFFRKDGVVFFDSRKGLKKGIWRVDEGKVCFKYNGENKWRCSEVTQRPAGVDIRGNRATIKPFKSLLEPGEIYLGDNKVKFKSGDAASLETKYERLSRKANNKSRSSSDADLAGAAIVLGGVALGLKMLFGGGSSSSSSAGYSGRTYSGTSDNSSTTTASSNTSRSAPHVTSITNDGNVTIVKCSIGEDTKVYHDNYGKCTDNYQFGSYGCSSVMRWAKERCERR